MAALDLTRDVPRSPFDELDGFAWLPRLIDKTRSHFAGTRGEYSAYPCPGDKIYLHAFGIDSRALGELIKGGADDPTIAAWVAANAKKPSDAPAKAAYRRTLTDPGNNPLLWLLTFGMRVKTAGAIKARNPQADFAKIDTLAKVIASEEGHPLPTI